MRIFLKIFLGFLVAIVAALCASGSSRAESPNSAPLGYFEVSIREGFAPSMPTALRRSVERDWRLFRGDRQLTSAARSCQPKAAWSARRFKNLAGQTLWTYYQQVYFCFNGRRVTYFNRQRWAEVGSLIPYVDWKPWQFKGHVGSNCQNEHCTSRGRAPSRTAWTQGSFEVCLIDFLGGLCNNQNPIVGITVQGDGQVFPFSRGG